VQNVKGLLALLSGLLMRANKRRTLALSPVSVEKVHDLMLAAVQG
jgi:hypothetical protein